MSHANGKIYSEVVNGVKVGVNTDDVVAVLGVASHDTKTLCANGHEKINKWSRHKPVRQQTIIGELTDAQFCAEDGNWGIELPTPSSDFKTLYASGNVWGYLPPNRAVDYGRLTDFDGYNHNAIPFAATGWGKNHLIKLDLYQNGDYIGISVNTSGPTNNDNLSLQDFYNVGGDNLYQSRLCARVYRIPSGTAESSWHNTSVWGEPVTIAWPVNYGASNQSEASGTIVSAGTSQYIWAGYNYLRFRIVGMPTQIPTEDVRPIYVVVLGMNTPSGYLPLPSDDNNRGYCFLRPYLLSWVEARVNYWSSGLKADNGYLRPMSTHTPQSYLPSGWQGDVYISLYIKNMSPNTITIGNYGSTVQTQFMSRDNSTQNRAIGGTLVNTSGNALTSNVTLNPSGQSNSSATIILKFPKLVASYSLNSAMVFPILVSHNKGASFTELCSQIISIE